MKKYDKVLPNLEKNLTKKVIEKERKQKIGKSEVPLTFRLYKINQVKAFSFYNSIKEKELKMRQPVFKKIQKINSEDNYKNKLLSINNIKSKTIEVKNLKKTIFQKKIKEKNGTKDNYILRPLDYYESVPVNYFKESFFSKKDNSDFKCIISQKEKENLYKKNIENKYNIKINRIKLYSRNKKLFANALKNNPNYFKKNYKSYIKSLSKYSSLNFNHFNKNNSTISIIGNDILNIKGYTNNNLPKDKIIINSINPNNNKYKYIKIKK